MKTFIKTALVLSAAVCAAMPVANAADVTLKASHQWPGGKGDVRDEMVQILAREMEKADVGVKIQVYPGKSLFKPKEQWGAMVKGQLDISAFPLDYASGRHPEFSATLMPGLVRNHERAARLNTSPFMDDIKQVINDAGVVVSGGCMAGRRVCLQEAVHHQPGDHEGAGDPRGRSGLRRNARGCRCLDRVPCRHRKSTPACRPAFWMPPTRRPVLSCPIGSTNR